MTYDLRARPLLVILFLCVLAAAVGLFALQRRSTDSGPTSAVSPRPRRGRTPHGRRPHRTVPRRPRPGRSRRRDRSLRRSSSLADKLPVAIRRALAADDVVVVALYDPRAKIDGTAMAEARAGAEKAGSSFVPVDVRGKGVESLNAMYGVLQDPAVLVLRPPGSLVVRIDGFADRDTVAQAALNAA